MASTTWVGGSSGNETDWGTGANWSTGSVPTTSAHVVIPNTTHSCALDTTRTIGSLTIQAGGTIIGGGNKLFIQSEGDASGGTEHYALKNDGIVSGNLDLDFTFAGETAADFTGSSGNFRNIKINAAGADVNQVGAATFDSLIIVANSTYDAGNDGLTISGDVSCTGTFLGNSTTAISHGSLTINSGGTYSATSGTTTITSEAGSGYAIEVSGTYTPNAGTLKITTDATTLVKILDDVHHLIIEPATATRLYEWVNSTTIQGNLTINAGRFAHYSSVFSLDVQGDCAVNNTGILDGGSGSIELGSLTIASGGEYRATTGTTTLTGTGTILDIDGTFTHNSGKVTITSAGDHQVLLPGGATFNNIDVDTSTGHDTKLREDITILGTLDLTDSSDYWIVDANGAAGNVTMTMGSSTASGTIESSDARRFRLNTHATRKCIIQGASTLFPCNVTGQDWKWDYGSGAAGTELANMNFQVDVDTHSSGSNPGNITLTGDCEFDAVTVSSGDTFDVNGQRVKFGGNVTYQGTIDADGLLVFHGGFTKYGTLNNAASGDIMTMSTSGFPTFSYITGYRTFFANGGVQLGTGGFTSIPTAIIASGELKAGTRNCSATNLTIATAGEFEAGTSANTHTISGDFTISGGLIGKSGLDFDGSTATASPFTFLDVPYDLSNLQNSDATIEMWIFPESKSGDAKPAGIINGYVGGQTNRWQFDHLTNDTFNFNSHENNKAINFTPNIGKMNHIALVFDDSENLLQIYHDGKLVGQNTLGTGIDLGTVGADPDLGISWQTTAKDTIRSGYMGFRGQFYMYRIFNTARTQAQIRADMFNAHGDMASTTGLQVMYQFDEGTGGAGDTVDNKEGTASRDGVLSNPGAAPNWVGAGTFDDGTSTLDFTGDGEWAISDTTTNYYNVKVAASGKTTTINSVGSSERRPRITNLLTHGGGTLTDINNADITFHGTGTHTAGADLSGLYITYWPSSTDIPGGTYQFLITQHNDLSTTGNITCNGYFAISSSEGFDLKDQTLTTPRSIHYANSTFNMDAGSIVFTGANGLTGDYSGRTFTAGPGATITGVAGKSGFFSENNYVVVGKVENLDVTNEELSVTGQVINCTGDIIQQFPTIDHDQQLDYDTADDRDIILGRDLDKNTELINS